MIDLEKPAQAAGKAERESVAYWMTENGYATGQGDSISGMLLELISQVRERSASAAVGKAAAMPMSVADIKKQFAEFMTDLADLTVEERAAEALLAARDYIAEDNNPKSNRVLQMIKIALDDLPATAAEPTREETIEECAKVVGDMRQRDAGDFSPARSGQRGEDRSNALYDAYRAILALSKLGHHEP